MKGMCVRLLVNDFDKVFNFYTETLGLAVRWGSKGDIYGSFAIGDDIVLSIYSLEAMENNMEFFTQKNERIGDKAVLTFSVNDVDKVYKELLEKDIKILNEPKDMTGWGIRVIYLYDPEDNLIEISEELPQDKWSQGLKDTSKKYNLN